MNVVFRVDSSTQLGTGHVMRCLTLADELRRNGVNISFICRELPGNIYSHVEKKGIKVYRLPEDSIKNQRSVNKIQVDAEETKAVFRRDFQCIDWLIVDHYGLDAQWETQMKKYVKKIMVIDDLANRPHDCDLILDQTFGEDGDKYSGLIPEHCIGLYGIKYALLRPQFAEYRRKIISRTDIAENHIVHIFFGGVDNSNYTARFSRLLVRSFPDLTLRIVVGNSYRYLASLKDLSEKYGKRIGWQQNVNNMAAHMSSCTVALGAPGMATWERACMGLPSAYLAISNNQINILKKIAEKGLCVYLGLANLISDKEFVIRFNDFLNDREKLVSMREIGMSCSDGLGLKRVASFIMTGGS